MTQSNENTESQGARIDTQDVLLAQVRDSLRNLRFGHVQIIVQDGVVVQIDRLERRRISRNERQTP
jgi:hypothetical protein